MKKIARSLMLLTAALFVFSACDFSYYVPEEFGAWDNNYIYRGNVRSKTTGEAWEYLVEEVSDGNENYRTLSCNDYAILGDEIYLCLSLDNTATAEIESVSSIIKYNVKNKTQENLLVEELSVSGSADGQSGVWSYEPYSIERMFEDRLTIYGRRAFTADGEVEDSNIEFVYYTIDLFGNFVSVEAFSPNEYSRVSEDYFIKTEASLDEGFSSLYYITWGMEEAEYISYLAAKEKVEFFDKGENKVFIFTYEYVKTTEKEPLNYVQIEYMKIGGIGPRSFIYTGPKSGFKWVDSERDYYFTSKEEDVTYKYKESFFGAATEQTQRVSTHYQLYQVNYEYHNSHKHVYTFQENVSIGDLGIMDEKLHVAVTRYENAFGCSGGGVSVEYYALDLSTAAFKKVPASEALNYGDFNEYYAREKGVKCGNYTYYLDKQAYGVSINDYQNYAYKLQRYDGKTTETMQIWSTSSIQPEGAKFCQQMWKNGGGDLNDFIVRNY